MSISIISCGVFMFDKYADLTMQVLQEAREECVRLQAPDIGTEHLLVALTDESSGLTAMALSSMGIDRDKVEKEARRTAESAGGKKLGLRSAGDLGTGETAQEPGFSDRAVEAIRLAEDHSRFFGQDEVRPEHLLLAIVDLAESLGANILEEMGANLPFLRRRVIHLMAQECSFNQCAPAFKDALVNGLTELISINQGAADSLAALGRRSGATLRHVPDRAEIVHMVCVAYLPELLSTQVAFQRHLLEESVKLLSERTGALDQELTASIVSNAAQHLRSETRATVEFLWCHEYRLFDQLLDDAEHDLIGSVIEDLWWAHSEELALHELFDSALVDHRRKQALTLQKRRIEISQRITKLKDRLAETIRQCFTKRSGVA